MLGPRSLITRLLTLLVPVSEFGEGPNSWRLLGGALRRCFPVHSKNPPFIAEKPPFMAKTRNSWTTAMSRN
jgi:hypothetical protein